VLALILGINAPAHAAARGDLHAPASGASSAGEVAKGDATAIEYGLIAALVAVVIITGLTALGTSLDEKFEAVADCVGIAEGDSTCGHQGKRSGQIVDLRTEYYQAQHTPGQITSTDTSFYVPFDGGAEASIDVAEASDFQNNVFTVNVGERVLNSGSAVDAPDTGLRHELVWTYSLFADDPNQIAGPNDRALIHIDIGFDSIRWGINGPVPHQNGVFEIEGPGGVIYAFEIEHVPGSGLQLISTTKYEPSEFAIGALPGSVTLQGLSFASEEVLSKVPVAGFDVEIPYNQATDVAFTLRHTSHSSAFKVATASPPAVSRTRVEQNVPNPFNPRTEIPIVLESAGRVELVIYDGRGHEVRRIHGGWMDTGSHRVIWDGKDDSGEELAAGMYLYQLQFNGRSISARKAIVVR